MFVSQGKVTFQEINIATEILEVASFCILTVVETLYCHRLISEWSGTLGEAVDLP